MTIISKKMDTQNVSFILAQVKAEKFALIVRDEDANELISRVEGPEALIRSKYEQAVAKAGAA